MSPEDASHVFESLTTKQRETLALASTHMTSKQIAIALGVAPVTIDKRIETVRARLGHISRSELIRIYRHWSLETDHMDLYDQAMHDPIILGMTATELPLRSPQPPDGSLRFEDSIRFDTRASWEAHPVRMRPGWNLSDFGIGARLAMMLAGALVIMMIAVLCMAFVDALMSILDR